MGKNVVPVYRRNLFFQFRIRSGSPQPPHQLKVFEEEGVWGEETFWRKFPLLSQFPSVPFVSSSSLCRFDK